ncbi:MAG: hypothetical protein IJK33_04350 [Clostridia bacterium]|nr:hypothetical protein [Clostridia bacterium]
MKKLIMIALAFLMIVSLAACGSGVNNPGGNTESKPGGQQGTNNNSNPSGTVVGVESDLYAPNAGSQADKYWHVKEIKMAYEFDKDGKCTVRDTVYYLKSASDYEDAKSQLEGGGFAAVWSSDKTYFSIDQGFKDYTSVENAIEEVEKDFLGYTLTYSGGGTKYVDPPTDERKIEIMKEVFGFTCDDIKTSFGNYEYNIRKKNKVAVTYISGAGAADINALAKAAFDVCSGLADEGKIYDYLGKYGSELTAAPETDNIFNSAKFNYFRNGKEITVEAQILNSEGYDNTLALLIAVVN